MSHEIGRAEYDKMFEQEVAGTAGSVVTVIELNYTVPMRSSTMDYGRILTVSKLLGFLGLLIYS